jgi:hypothetical protein
MGIMLLYYLKKLNYNSFMGVSISNDADPMHHIFFGFWTKTSDWLLVLRETGYRTSLPKNAKREPEKALLGQGLK